MEKSVHRPRGYGIDSFDDPALWNDDIAKADADAWRALSPQAWGGVHADLTKAAPVERKSIEAAVLGALAPSPESTPEMKVRIAIDLLIRYLAGMDIVLTDEVTATEILWASGFNGQTVTDEMLSAAGRLGRAMKHASEMATLKKSWRDDERSFRISRAPDPLNIAGQWGRERGR
jgi:hypothetical protein